MDKWKCWAVLLIAGGGGFLFAGDILSPSPSSLNQYECIVGIVLLALGSADLCIPGKVNDLLLSMPLTVRLVVVLLLAALSYQEFRFGLLDVSRLISLALDVIIAWRLLFPSSNGK